MSLLLTGMDVTIVNVALPVIQHELHATVAQLQWIIDSYTLVVASLLMLCGSLSDRYGRRRVFLIGMSTFAVGSLLCSFAPNIHALIAFRALQGVGASMMNPVALSIIANVFTEPKARARAVGVWGAVAGVSLGVGPLLGGILTEIVGWRAIFWVNLPIAILAILLAVKYVPESRSPKPRRPDPLGQLLVLAFLTLLTYAVIDSPRTGWGSASTITMLVVSALLFVAFLWHEAHRREPMLDLRFFRSVPFSSATVIALTAFASFAGFLFLNALYLQQARGLSALHTGLCTLPLAVAMLVAAPLSGRLVAARGPLPPLVISGLSFIGSMLILVRLSDAMPLPVLLVSYVLFGIGLGMVNPAISNTAVAGMPLSQAGVAAAIASTGRQVGAALGVAVAGTVIVMAKQHHADFARSTHPVWWAMLASGVLVLAAGAVSNTAWSRASVTGVKALLES